MNWQLIFTIANGWALLAWLALIFAPRRAPVMWVIFYAGVGLLAATYSAIIIPLMTGLIDGGQADGSPSFTALAGVKALLSSDGGATIGWIHYLAFDLFVGIWIARNADQHGISRIIQFPLLFFTFMLGPFGLMLYLLLRLVWRKRPSEAQVPR